MKDAVKTKYSLQIWNQLSYKNIKILHRKCVSHNILDLILKHQWTLHVGIISLSYSTTDCNRMPFKMGIIQFEGDSSLWDSAF